MGSDNYQLTWTDQQWGRIRQVVQEEANRARVAATFLPLHGPLPADTDFVSADELTYRVPPGGGALRMSVNDTKTIPLTTLQVKVFLRGAQVADPELTSALQLFRRAANVLARLEDLVVFNGQAGMSRGPDVDSGQSGLQDIWQILGGREDRTPGLATPADGAPAPVTVHDADESAWGDLLVERISTAIGTLEAAGHFGPFAVVLDQGLFSAVQRPNENSLVLPQDRIIPFLGGGPLLRSSALPRNSGIVVGLGGAPIDLDVATDVSVAFLQVTTDPLFVFRVYEKIALRIKEADAVVRLEAFASHGATQ